MHHTLSLWRVFTAIMIAVAMGSCATSPTQPVLAPALSVKPQTDLIDHKYFVIQYDRKYRLARWVKYTMTRDQLMTQKAKRRNRFKADPLLTDPAMKPVRPSEYTKTGYDQGHLAPSADFAFSQEANDATFVMSNMVPQKPKLNRVAWRMLEEQVRRWACGEEKVTVITGPILEGKMAALPGGLTVPNEFFKVIIDETEPVRAKAFVYHQQDSRNVLAEREVDLKKLDRRLNENFSAYVESERRDPAQAAASLQPWRECVP